MNDANAIVGTSAPSRSPHGERQSMSVQEKLHGLLFAATYVREIIDDPKTPSEDLSALGRIHLGLTDYMTKLKTQLPGEH